MTPSNIFALCLIITSCNYHSLAEVDSSNVDLILLQQRNQARISIDQGVAGTLTMKQGNCMPMIEPGTTTCKQFPISRKIYVSEYTMLNQTERDSSFLFKAIVTNKILEMTADNDGFFQTRLAPGKYSVFVEEHGKLYANSFDGYGGINPMEISQDIVTTFNLVVDHAVY